MSIFSEIKKGVHDDDLEEIVAAVMKRRKVLAQQLFHDLEVGDEVVVAGGIKPKYMIGRRGTVIAKRQTKVEVDFKVPMGRFGAQLIVPVSCLELVGKED